MVAKSIVIKLIIKNFIKGTIEYKNSESKAINHTKITYRELNSQINC